MVVIECPICKGTGKGVTLSPEKSLPCPHCQDGQFIIPGCPQTYIGSEIAGAANLASMCGQGDWPVAGGLLNQAAWFVEFKRKLDADINQIQDEEIEKNAKRRDH